MQSIKGKKESLLRVLGMVLILFGLIASLIFDFFIIDTGLYILTVLVMLPWFILIVLLKLEKDFFVENMVKFFLALSIYSVVIIIIGIIGASTAFVMLYIMIVISNILIIFCWHYALSIFKKEKLIFLIGGIGYCVLVIVFKLSLFLLLGMILGLVPLVFVILGIFLIIIAEMRMKRKGLLNYV